MTVALAACGAGGGEATVVRGSPPVIATAAATATVNPARVRATGIVQENAATSRVITIRTAESVWYIGWDAIARLDGPRGPITPADLPVGATVAFEGDPDPLAKTPTLRQAVIRVQ